MALAQNSTRTRRAQRSRQHAPGATGPGAIGRLLDPLTGARMGRVLVDGEVYGPVPVTPYAGVDPFNHLIAIVAGAPGDRIFLHLDMRGQPAYAQLLPA